MALNERVQRMRGAIGIPQRECAVVMQLWREMMNLAIHAPIPAVDIVEQCRRQHHVVQPGVEDFFFLLVRALDADSGEFTLP